MILKPNLSFFEHYIFLNSKFMIITIYHNAHIYR